MKKKMLLITLAVLSLIFVYLFVPILPLTFPSQEQFGSDPDVRLALASVAEEWGVPESSLYIFAVVINDWGNDDKSKHIEIIDPETLSSAYVWVFPSLMETGQQRSMLDNPDKKIVMRSQYIPRSALERTIARNFYTKSKWAKSKKAIIMDIKSGTPFGFITANSLTMGNFLIPTLFSYPLFIRFSELHGSY